MHETEKTTAPQTAAPETAPPSAPSRVLAPAARRALEEAAARRAAENPPSPAPREIDGRGGPEPVRYGDWEVKGIASDF